MIILVIRERLTVIRTAAEVVMGWTLQGQLLLQRLAFQVVLQDGFDADVRAGAEMPGAPAGGFQTHGPLGFAQTNDAQAGTKTLFRMRTAGHDVFYHPRAVWPDLPSPLHDPAGRPFQVFLMRLGPVFLQGAKASALRTALHAPPPVCAGEKIPPLNRSFGRAAPHESVGREHCNSGFRPRRDNQCSPWLLTKWPIRRVSAAVARAGPSRALQTNCCGNLRVSEKVVR